MKRNIKNIIKRLLDTKKTTRHRVVPNDFGKYPTIHSKQRRSYVYTDAFGCPHLLRPATDMFGIPILHPRTETYGRSMADGATKTASIQPKRNSRVWRFTNRCGVQVSSITPSTTSYTSPTPVPKTDKFGKPVMITEGLIKSSTITPGSTNTTNLHQGTKSQTKAVVITKTYLYVAVGAVTFLLITAAVLLLFVWVMKRKNQRRVENAEICET